MVVKNCRTAPTKAQTKRYVNMNILLEAFEEEVKGDHAFQEIYYDAETETTLPWMALREGTFLFIEINSKPTF